MASVEFEHVHKRYGAGPPVIEDLNLRIEDKEFLVLVGPSGCGKSTALRMIAGLERVTQGDLRIDGQVVNDLHPKHRNLAMVFQNYALYPHLTCAQNLAFALKLRGEPKATVEKRVAETAKLLEIEHLLDRKPKALSGGQRQRVAIGRAIVREPKLFLMDEPLSNLDAKLRVSMRAELKRLHQRLQTTFVYVTHDQTEAMTLGTRIAILKGGVLQQVASPHEVYHRPANVFVATFIGSPQMNLLDAELSFDGETSVLRGPDFRFTLPKERAHVAGPVLLGVRPEHLERTAGPGELGLRSTVEVVEPLGFESLVYLTGAKGSVIARVTGDSAPQPGAQVRLTAAPDKLHLFDPKTERRL